MRTCTICKITKKEDNFFKAKRQKSGFHSACKKCHTKQVKEWRKVNRIKFNSIQRELSRKYRKQGKSSSKEWKLNNVEKNREQQRKRYEKIKKTVYEYYCEGIPFCQCCGEKNNRFLTIDHVNNNGSEHRKTVASGGSLFYWIIRHNFPKGFQILCMNCNYGKRYTGVCPHKLSIID